MQIGKNQAFWASVILHLMVLLCLFLATVVSFFRPKEEEHVFVMVDPPGERAESPADLNEPVPELDLPEIEPLRDIPDPVIPEPAPRPPTPTPPAPTPPKPAPKDELVHIDDVRDQITQRNPQPRSNPPKVELDPIEINTQAMRKRLQGLVTDQRELEKIAQMTAAEQSALQRYGQQLNARLNRAWVKPANLSGVRLTAQVEFDVAPDGRILSTRLRPSSSNRAFDQSVLAAFAKVASAGPTPTGQRHTFTMAFRMRDS